MEEHHVYPASNRNKSELYGLKACLCGETCHRNGNRSAHGCRETANELKRHFQIRYMDENHASIEDFRREFGKSYLVEPEYYEDERSYQMNIVAVSGRLTRDPEIRTTQSGKAVCTFRIAVDRPGTKDTADFFTCVAWEKKAEFVNRFFHKGSKIEVSGIVMTREYEKDGQKRTATELRADQVFFGDSKKNEDTSANQSSSSDFEEVDDDEDLPF